MNMNSEAPLVSGADLIAAERQRQIDVEGYTPEHDDHHIDDLAKAAAAYLVIGWGEYGTGSRLWPWGGNTPWKTYASGVAPVEDRVRELVKAGALVAAEIDRLQRGQQAIEQAVSRV